MTVRAGRTGRSTTALPSSHFGYVQLPHAIVQATSRVSCPARASRSSLDALRHSQTSVWFLSLHCCGISDHYMLRSSRRAAAAHIVPAMRRSGGRTPVGAQQRMHVFARARRRGSRRARSSFRLRRHRWSCARGRGSSRASGRGSDGAQRWCTGADACPLLPTTRRAASTPVRRARRTLDSRRPAGSPTTSGRRGHIDSRRVARPGRARPCFCTVANELTLAS